MVDAGRAKLAELGASPTPDACERAMREAAAAKKWGLLWALEDAALVPLPRLEALYGALLVELLAAQVRTVHLPVVRLVESQLLEVSEGGLAESNSDVSASQNIAGDESGVLTELVSRGANLDHADNTKRTALAFALQGRLEALAVQLIDHGADVNRRYSSGTTALILAAKQGLDTACARLVAAGADPEARDWQGQRALGHAAEKNFVGACRALLDAGCPADETRAQYAAYAHLTKSPLIQAAEKGHTEVCALLLEHGADPDAKDGAGDRTPLMYAAENGHAGAFSVLLEGAQALPSHTAAQGKTLLMCAAGAGLAEHLPRLLEVKFEFTEPPEAETNDADAVADRNLGTGPPRTPPRRRRTTPKVEPLLPPPENSAALLAIDGVDACDRAEFKTALMCAAEGGHAAACRALLAAGADANRQSRAAKTALVYSVQTGKSAAAAAALLEAGADVESADAERNTALMYAAQQGSQELVELLVNAGADVGWSQPETGATALTRAAQHGHVEVCKALLAVDPDLFRRADAFGHTPLFNCGASGVDVAELLLAAGAGVDEQDVALRTSLSHAAEFGHIDFAALLTRHNADLRLVDATGRTPLHFAAAAGHTELCTLLIAVDKERRAVDGDGDGTPALASVSDVTGKTALHYACVRFLSETRDVLLEGGADVNAVEGEGGWTPLMISATWATSDAHMVYCLELVDKGASVTMVDRTGSTALHHAAMRGHIATCLSLCGVAPQGAIDAHDIAKRTPLLVAVQCGHKQLCEELIKAGAKVTPKARVAYERKFGPLKKCVCQ
eukprot:TRINITY_DN16738_c0_g1_i2.p1 TRINITY_DN16738_c0_g1~~TRINITY_DN16738_c0_g1_i2.p1  ORF type:complete len:820 (+),score=208.67 TRINITY_DN16738_c0_g1_i2:82-2460(+)